MENLIAGVAKRDVTDLDRYQLRREAAEVYAVQKTFEPVRG
ncbi:MAG: hypothetical protein QXN53_09250 [Thermoproteota archaeon]